MRCNAGRMYQRLGPASRMKRFRHVFHRSSREPRATPPEPQRASAGAGTVKGGQPACRVAGVRVPLTQLGATAQRRRRPERFGRWVCVDLSSVLVSPVSRRWLQPRSVVQRNPLRTQRPCRNVSSRSTFLRPLATAVVRRPAFEQGIAASAIATAPSSRVGTVGPFAPSRPRSVAAPVASTLWETRPSQLPATSLLCRLGKS